MRLSKPSGAFVASPVPAMLTMQILLGLHREETSCSAVRSKLGDFLWSSVSRHRSVIHRLAVIVFSLEDDPRCWLVSSPTTFFAWR
jgi:hypothetical protein